MAQERGISSSSGPVLLDRILTSAGGLVKGASPNPFQEREERVGWGRGGEEDDRLGMEERERSRW